MKTNHKTVFQSWFESNPDAVFIMDKQGKLIEANDRVLQYFGISIKKLLQLSFFDLFVWPEMDASSRPSKNEGNFFIEGIHQIRTKDSKPIEINTSFISYEGRDVMLCFYRDNTTRNKTDGISGEILFDSSMHSQKDFKEQLSTVQSILNHTDLFIFSVDKNYRYTSFSKRHVSTMKQIYGGEPKIGNSFLDILSVSKDREEAKASIDQALAGEQLVQESYKGEELRSRLYFQLSHNPIRLETGEVIGVVILAQDLTDHKKAEETLRESVERYRLIAENTADTITVLDLNLKITFVSPSIMKLRGYTVEESTLQSVDQIFTSESMQRIKNLFADEMALEVSGESDPSRTVSLEMEEYCKDGSTIWVEIAVSFLRDTTLKPTEILTVTRDITKRKIAEDALLRAHDEMERNVEKRTSELKKANEQLAALYKVGQIITAPLQLKKVLDAIALNTSKLLGSDTGVILLIDEDGETLTIQGAYGLRKEVVIGTRDRIGESIAGRVVQTGQPIIANDLPNDKRFYNPSAAHEGLLACASVPLIVAGKIIGTLDIHSKTDRQAFGDEHIHILKMLASQAAIAIENARLYEQIRLTRDELEIRVQQRTVDLITSNSKLQQGITELRQTETALWESSQMLKLVLNNMPAFVFWKDCNSVYLGCNNLFAANAGLNSPEDIIGKTDLELPWKSTEAESYRADDRLVIVTGVSKLNYEETQLTASGRNTRIRTSKVPLKNVAGDIIGILGTFEDITERKRVEGELHQSNSLLSTIIEAAPTAIIDLDLEGNVKAVWNPAAEKLLGWKSEEVIGKLLPTVSMEKQDEFRQFLDQIRSGKTLNGIEVQRQKRDGSPIEYCIYASPLYDSEGSISGNVAVLTDISDRKRSEREIAQMNRALRLLSNSNQVLIHTTDETSLYNEICRNTVETGGYLMAWVGLIEHDEQKIIRCVAQKGQDLDYIESVDMNWADDTLDQSPFGIAIKTEQPCIVHEIQTDPLYDSWRNAAIRKGYKSIIALPLINEGQILGTLGIYSGETNAFNDKEVEVLAELADDLAFGISALRSRDRKKLAEDALRDSEARFSAVFRFSPLAIAIFRVEDGCFIDANDVFINMSGYTREEIIGRTTTVMDIYINPSDRDLVLKKLQEKGMVDSFEFDTHNKAGEIRTVISAITFIDIKGEKHYLALLLDITERKKSEERLRLLSTALEAAANSIVITDQDAMIIWANDAFSKLTGYALDEAIGKNPRDLVYSGIHSRDFYEHMWKTILNGNVWHGEIINKNKNGTIFNEFLTITPVRDKNNMIRHFIAVKQDITKQKKAEDELLKAKEKAEESNQLKSAFLATMNHELRTPLNHILGFSDLMRSGAILENIADYADIIHKSSQNLLEIIEGIFELALAEQSDIKLQLKSFKCLDLFLSNKSVLTEILEISGKKDLIDLVFNADKELLLQSITTDKNKINQVLINLFKNAVKFTKSGKIEFGLKKEEIGWITFYVADTGIGINENKHEIVFEFFRQADDSFTREYGGIGIGLAISKKIAEVMKGSLSFESKPDKGSTFYFKIPVSITSFNNTRFNDEIKRINIPDLQGKTILIAEDDLVSIDLIRNYLSKTGVRLIEAPNGKEVIEKLSINPDIILMDLNMPIMDGYTATRIVKSRRPDIPVIAITAYALSADKIRATEAGCDGIISKPVDQRILLGELKKHLLPGQE